MAAGRRRAVTGLGFQREASFARQVRALTRHARALELGRLNNTQEVALAADGIATTTAVTIPGVRASSCVFLSPIDANAGAAIAAGVHVVCTKDTVTIHHPASAGARSLRLAVFA